ncbi:MAG: ISAzo13 family transposase, partial [Patescibacteria group bacterium]
MNSKQQYAILKETLNEYQWRIYLGTEAKRIGFSGQKQVSLLSGADPKTIRRGMLEAEKPLLVGRIRLKGGGRKKIQDKDSTLVKDLEKVLEPKGDPMSILQWTTKSLTNLVFFLESKKHTIKRTALRKLLIGLGFSLKGNKKNIEGKSHPDRDEQFKHIKKSCEEFEKQKDPIISVDCKKKELIGNFKNNGKEWQAKGKNTIVNVYDFQSIADGKAAPYGIYDV